MLPDPVRDIALTLPSLPAYVYDLGGLSAHVAAIRAALPRSVELYYAVKANPDVRVLRTVAGYVDGFEVSSGGERAHAASLGKTAFGGPGKTFADLVSAVQAGTHRFHVESPHEFSSLASAAASAGRVVDVLLRVNLDGDVDAALVMGGRPSAFGMDAALLDECAESEWVRVRGLHAHVASGLDVPGLLVVAREMLSFGRQWCLSRGILEPEFNLGGGMAVDYRRPDSVFDWALYGRGLAELVSPGETLRIEPGRAITAYCGWYLTRVLDVKRSHGEAFAVVEGGTHHLRTPAAKGHDQPLTVIPVASWSYDWARPSAADCLVTFCGQLCTPKDILARRVPVSGVRAGDLVAFGMAGAYAWNISHHSFLMHPEPTFHYLHGVDER
jgi:diaminopimelate decarboxylase